MCRMLPVVAAPPPVSFVQRACGHSARAAPNWSMHIQYEATSLMIWSTAPFRLLANDQPIEPG